MTTEDRYARQRAVPGVGENGQRAIEAAFATVRGADLAAEVCALYLAGSGVGRIGARPEILATARALNGTIGLESLGAGDDDAGITVEVDGVRFTPEEGSSLERGARAARWALARILGRAERSGRGDGR